MHRLELENRHLRLTVRRLRQLAYLDGLTGLANRRHFEAVLASEVRRTARGDGHLSLLFCDIDHFKRINDRCGHASGDNVLQALGPVLRSHCRRAGDLAARYGGEEFVVLLPGVRAKEAIAIAQRLRGSVRDLSVPCERHGDPLRITVSVGVAARGPGAPRSPCELIRAADAALYRAKRAGRNRCCLALRD
jgi:diguanylate cyclase